MRQDIELIEDLGILSSWKDHPVELLDPPELAESQPATPLMVRLNEMVVDGLERGMDVVRRHKKGAAKLGALAAATTTAGFATGAVIFTHRHA